MQYNLNLWPNRPSYSKIPAYLSFTIFVAAFIECTFSRDHVLYPFVDINSAVKVIGDRGLSPPAVAWAFSAAI